MLQHIIFLYFVSFFTNDIPFVFPIDNSKNFNIVLVQGHCIVHRVSHRSVITFMIGDHTILLELRVEFVLLLLFFIYFLLILLANGNFNGRMKIKSKVLVEQFIRNNLGKTCWGSFDI